jgi:hypothetical protein
VYHPRCHTPNPTRQISAAAFRVESLAHYRSLWNMLSVTTQASSSDISPAFPVRRLTSAMPPVQEPTPPQLGHQEQHVKQEHEPDRGRIRSRSDEKDAEGDEHDQTANGYGDERHANSSNSDGGPSRKRRRSRKGLDKKFECPEKDCGRSYSRAEHLYEPYLFTSRSIWAAGGIRCGSSC